MYKHVHPNRLSSRTRTPYAPMTYTLGDTIRVEVDLRDENGVAGVRAFFEHVSNPDLTIELAGDGGSHEDVSVTLKKEVTPDTAPGEYKLRYLAVSDVKGNTEFYYYLTGMGFKVDHVLSDYEGPKLTNWRIERFQSQPVYLSSAEDPALSPEDLIWIFASERTGSTWLARMMSELPDMRAGTSLLSVCCSDGFTARLAGNTPRVIRILAACASTRVAERATSYWASITGRAGYVL